MTVAATPDVEPASAPSRSRPSIDVVWAALATVPDPEVPVISIVELGIVRDVLWDDSRLVVKVTPTYSGCPATEMINELIRESLAIIGITDVLLVTQLAPPWTTDWIAPEAKARLKGFGIAPPHVMGGQVDVSGISPLRRAKVAVPCPRCHSANTTLISQFGSTACKAQYRCDDCREPFDYFKPH
ncbi:MAG TPA: phenylacetate-CoA oxygenase subunit PaaJ [Casimicrobiaceae bacterium]|nr:phenylacetate-CoA oxygenase subunit PaaJ [Casimicrobiaceae bacterium]